MMSFELVAHVLIGFGAFGLVCVIGGGAAYVGVWAARSPQRTHRQKTPVAPLAP